MPSPSKEKIKFGEKIGYALGDTAANIAWRTLTTFLLVFYTDVYGLSAAATAVLLLSTRILDGFTDILMGILADRTQSSKGKFRPWILWTAVPFGIVLSLTFSTPNFGPTGKLIYAYAAYILLTLIYTANNVPYSALMGVMTADSKERTSLSSFRFAGAYLGGILVQGLLIYLVLFLGNGNENEGYRYAIYWFSALLTFFLLITYFSTKERVQAPPRAGSGNVLQDLRDLLKNKPWLLLLLVGFLFVTYNSIKQGITVLYFKRFIGDGNMAASYMVALLVASLLAAICTTPLAEKWGKRNLFMGVIIFSAICNGMLYFFGPEDVLQVYIFGVLSEFGAGMMPVLFFAMLGDSADYSEWKYGRRATGLVYSAGSFAMKFGGGVAGAIIGFVLSLHGYDGLDESTMPQAVPGIRMLMSWVPATLALPLFAVLWRYPLDGASLGKMSDELSKQRSTL
ncbi:MFS transporter [Marinilongibacter aquaticus]|uniref:MFS transporter n=1 Tax=Marinilongibacter aquaticus TaxID=2975157 RepID=UPI0021BDEAAC|nr:MFS transporter [Marinilongibacter aquaticus]UBM57322.1 MFS transporter [Marinilongibacter aquaticus]